MFPTCRGTRLQGKLLDEASERARREGAQNLFASTAHVGLYEKYGFISDHTAPDIHGQPVRIYRKSVR